MWILFCEAFWLCICVDTQLSMWNTLLRWQSKNLRSLCCNHWTLPSHRPRQTQCKRVSLLVWTLCLIQFLDVMKCFLLVTFEPFKYIKSFLVRGRCLDCQPWLRYLGFDPQPDLISYNQLLWSWSQNSLLLWVATSSSVFSLKTPGFREEGFCGC